MIFLGATSGVGSQSELRRLHLLGWEAPPRDADGVRWLRRDGAQVSFPREVFGMQSGDGGEGFWLDARADVVGQLLREASITKIWDVGAGSGAMAKRLGRYGIDVLSVEPLPEGALGIARMGAEVFCATLHDLGLPPGSLSAVGLFDVVEHLQEPSGLLGEVARVLSPGGKLVVTVPAYQWLWSAEDEALGHFRRYSTKSLHRALVQSQLTVLSTRYCFASLVLPAALLRTLPYRLGRRSTPDEVLSRNIARFNPGLSSSLARRMLALEAKAANHVRLPFGLSVLAVAQRRPVPGAR